MFEVGKKYVFSKTKFIDDMLNHSSMSDVAKHKDIYETFDGYLFVGLGENRRDLYKGGLTMTVFPEWCVSGEVDDLI